MSRAMFVMVAGSLCLAVCAAISLGVEPSDEARTMDPNELWGIYGGSFTDRCCEEQNRCGNNESTCGEHQTNETCDFKESFTVNNRDMCTRPFNGASCDQGTLYECYAKYQCVWNGSSCAQFSTTPIATDSVPESCSDTPVLCEL